MKLFLTGYLWPNVKKAVKFAFFTILAIAILTLECLLCFWIGVIGLPILLILIFVDIAIAFSWDEYLIDIGKKRPY